MTHPNVHPLTEIVFSACLYNIETSWCSRTPHPYRIRCVQPRLLLLAQIGFILLQYIISCLCVGILCFRYFKLLLLYRMYQSVGHSVCKYTIQIVVQLCLDFYTIRRHILDYQSCNIYMGIYLILTPIGIPALRLFK